MDEIDFDGVFRFTNATKEDFVFFWNNKEYLFPAGSCCPLIIGDETLENIQSIRKKAAYKLATREYYKSSDYKRMVKLGKANPSTFDEKLLEPWIAECLKPLPIAKLKVRAGKKDSDRNYKATKAVDEKDDLNRIFKDSAIDELGAQSDKAPNIVGF